MGNRIKRGEKMWGRRRAERAWRGKASVEGGGDGWVDGLNGGRQEKRGKEKKRALQQIGSKTE